MRERVTGARVGRLATVGADGWPHAVPVCFVILGEAAYTAVDHKPKRHRRLRRLANIAADRRACLLVDEYGEDWSALWWVRLDGRARIVEDPGEAGNALDALVAKYRQYARSRPAGPVIALDVTGWTGWSASGPAS